MTQTPLSPAPDLNRRPLPYHEGDAFAAALAQGRHDQRFARETREQREATDELARALESAIEQERVPSRFPRIYFIQRGADGPIKIGYTTQDPQLRLRQLQVASAERLRLLGHVEVDGESEERDLHLRLASHRLGGEWFNPSDRVLEEIAWMKGDES